MPREIELTAVVENVDACRGRLEAAGAEMTFDGRLADRRYDTPDHRLRDADQVLRVRSSTDGQGPRAALEWKGPTGYEHGYKVREEISARHHVGLAVGRTLAVRARRAKPNNGLRT